MSGPIIPIQKRALVADIPAVDNICSTRNLGIVFISKFAPRTQPNGKKTVKHSANISVASYKCQVVARTNLPNLPIFIASFKAAGTVAFEKCHTVLIWIPLSILLNPLWFPQDCGCCRCPQQPSHNHGPRGGSPATLP